MKFLVFISLLVSPLLSFAGSHTCEPNLVGVTEKGGALVRCKTAVTVNGLKIDWFAVDIRPHIGVPADRSTLHILMAQSELINSSLLYNQKLYIEFYDNNVETSYDCLPSNCREIKNVFIVK